MVIGNGVDIVEIERISEIVKKNPRFLERCFTENERALFLEKGMRIETIAAGFAGKEAVSKALGQAIRRASANCFFSIISPSLNLIMEVKDSE